MNKVIIMGRLTREPNVTYSMGERQTAVARFTVAVDRPGARNSQSQDQPTADFISCVAFDRQGEFAEKYLHQGTKVVLEGRIQTGSYTNRDGQRVYTTDVVAERIEFAESKAAEQPNATTPQYNMQQGQQYYQAQQPAPQPAAQPSSGAAVPPSQRQSTQRKSGSAARSNTRSSQQPQAVPVQQAAPVQQEPFVDYNQMPQVDEGLPFN